MSLAVGAMFALASLPLHAQRLVGGDMSMLPKYEDAHVGYFDTDGSRIDNVLSYVADKAGFNVVRVRLFVNPPKTENGVVQDLDYVKTLGKRIKDGGMKFLLDFHYSDTWADPANQWTPDAWKSLSDTQLADKVYDYTKDCLQQLVNIGATPDYIQTGNEISYGMLWGPKGTGSPKKCTTGSDANWQRFRTLLTRAGQACREICPQAKIIIHTERTGNWSTTRGIYERLSSIDYDIIGLSYYPEWHNNLATLGNTLNNLHAQFAQKDVMIVETGYYNNWYPSNATYNFTSTWPASAAGQLKFLNELVSAVREKEWVKAIIYWFPEENPHNNRVYEPWYNHGLFDPNTGKAVEALFAMKNFVSTGIKGIADEKTNAGQHIYTLDGRRVNGDAALRKGIYVKDGRKVVVK